jgi:hypothetical protein
VSSSGSAWVPSTWSTTSWAASAVYLLSDTRDAFIDKSTKHIPGKVVLTP